MLSRKLPLENIGGKLEDYKGKSIREILPKKEAEIYFERIKKAITSDGPQEYEDYFCVYSEQKWFSSIFTKVANANGEIIGIQIASLNITERKIAEKSLEESQAFLQAAFDNSLAGIAIADAPDGKIRYVNKAALMIRDQSEEQLVKNIDVHKYVASWNIMHLDGTPYKEDEVPLTRAVLYGETCSEELIIRRDSFEDRIVLTNAAPIKDSDNKIKAGIVILLDITEKKQNEENIKRQNELMSSLLKVLPVGIFMVNAIDGKPLIANEMAKKLLGRGILPDAKLKNISEVYKAHKKGSVGPYPTEEMPIVKGMEGKESYINDMVVERPDGTEVLLEIYGTHITDDNGKTWASLVTFSDITERTREHDDLEEALKFNQDIINSSSNGIIVYDTELRYKIWNPFMEKLSGFSAQEVIGRKAEEVFPWLKESGVINNLKLSLEGQCLDEVDFTFNFSETEKTGWIRDQSGTLYNRSGDIVGVLGVVQDITEHKKSENLLKEMNESLVLRLLQTINAISKIGELRDVYTAGHQRKVAELSCAIAKELGLSDERISNISNGALIHDIGKINIASDILNKPGKISNLEYQIMQTHAEFGYEIVKEIDFPSQIIDMIHQHHERLDGSGYPQKLAGDQIILESRILAVADVVEAMMSHRPYRPALGIDVALEEISTYRGKKYDCDVVDACLKLFREKGFQFMIIN